MSYGFQIYNSNSQLIANSTDFGYGLVASGSSTTTAPSGLFQSTINFTDIGTGETPLVFVRMNNASSNLWVGLWSMSNTDVKFVTFGATGLYTRRNGAAGTFDYKIFAPFKNLPSVSGQNYGIQIFNGATPTNLKTFDSNYEIPRVVSTVNLTIPTPSNSIANPTVTAAIPSGVSSNPWINLSMIAGNASVYNQGIHFAGSGINNGSIEKCIRIFGGFIDLSFGCTIAPAPFSTSTWATGTGQNRLFYLMN